jgi:hypothetical protein
MPEVAQIAGSRLDAGRPATEHRRVSEDPDDIDSIADLDPREAARAKRRDHDADAERHDLMRPGMGKVFKQIQDTWERDATRPSKPRPRPTTRP